MSNEIKQLETNTSSVSEISVYESDDQALSLSQLKSQVNLIQEIMKAVMKEGEHYGTIPGCGDKKCLFKPGAEKLNLTFHLVPDVDVEVVELEKGHREYRSKVKIYTQKGIFLGTGIGSCSTMESKYRYRWDNTGREVPSKYWDHRDIALLGGSSFVPRKIGKEGRSKWMIFQKVEHDNPADYYNTCLKMAKKRASIDATLTVTAASDIFTQDLDEEVENKNNDSITPVPSGPMPTRTAKTDPSDKTVSDEKREIASPIIDFSTKINEAKNREELREVYTEIVNANIKEEEYKAHLTKLYKEKKDSLGGQYAVPT